MVRPTDETIAIKKKICYLQFARGGEHTTQSYRGKYLGWSGGRMRLGRSMSSPEPLLGFSGEEMGEAGSVQ